MLLSTCLLLGTAAVPGDGVVASRTTAVVPTHVVFQEPGDPSNPGGNGPGGPITEPPPHGPIIDPLDPSNPRPPGGDLGAAV